MRRCVRLYAKATRRPVNEAGTDARNVRELSVNISGTPLRFARCALG